jgi:hypothetical protein
MCRKIPPSWLAFLAAALIASPYANAQQISCTYTNFEAVLKGQGPASMASTVMTNCRNMVRSEF